MNRSPRVLLLVDWLPTQDTLIWKSLRQVGLDCEVMGINFHQSKWTPVNKLFSHWPRSFLIALKAFRLRHEYDFVIDWQQVMGTFLGFIKLLTFSQTPKVFILNATIVERKNPLLDALRRWFITLSWKKVEHIGFMSRAYLNLIQERFRLPKSKPVHLPLPLTFERNPEFSGFIPGGYVYSVGLSYRDFPTLIAAAKKSPRPFVLATNDFFLKGLTIPDNVLVYRNVFGEAAENLMRNAAVVVIPLMRTTSPAGETTLITAMCHGKPVIMTRTVTSQEYIRDGENGYLVPWGDPEAIVAVIERIFADPDQAEELGRRARQYVLENHSMDVFVRKVAQVTQDNFSGNL